MKSRPILFSAPMVRALLAGTKTQTRRVAKHPHVLSAKRINSYPGHTLFYCALQETVVGAASVGAVACPYGVPGDQLWVRETWAHHVQAQSAERDEDGPFVYAADGPQALQARLASKWTPGIHMFRWASRITLEITAVRVERLQDISEADALAEGVTPKWEPGCSGRLMEAIGGFSFRPAASAYADLWEQINGAGSWDANPWVWALSFKRV